MWWRWFFMSLCLLGGVPGVWANSSALVGTVSPVGNNPQIYLDDQPLKEQSDVRGNSFLRVVEGSALLQMNNGDRFTLSPGTLISIGEFTPNTEASAQPSFLKMFTGTLRALIERDEKEKIIIRTGNAVIGVKGTDFIVEMPSEELTQVTTLSGLVSFQRLDQTSQSVALAAGFRSLIVQAQAPSPPIQISSGDFRQIRQAFGIALEPNATMKLSETALLDQTVHREIERRVVQEALQNQAQLSVQLYFPKP